jgi:Fusaric acid resistance protein-like
VFLSTFLARELAPTHRRLAEAARTAIKATLTTGLVAIMQIAGPFGPLFAFRIGQPGISFGLFEGAVTIICAAGTQAAIVPITGKLLDYPGLILAFLFSIFAIIAYLISNTRLFMPLALVAIGTITTLYVGIFEPGEIGWGSTYTFDGILVATLVMVAIDSSIWPSPLEPRLLESIAADFASTRQRFQLVARRYLDRSLPPLPATIAKSRLAPSLALLNSVREHTKPAPHRFARLLNAITTSEHVYLAVERLAVLAEEPLSGVSMQKYAEQIQFAIKVIDAALIQQTEGILDGRRDIELSSETQAELRTMIRQLSALSTQITSDLSTTGILNCLAFVNGLQGIANLLELREFALDGAGAEASEAEEQLEARGPIDARKMRFSIKLAATMVLGLMVGLTTQRADLQTILWSIVVAGSPNQYGAVVRKTILRLTGCIIGGIAALAAMLLVSQNFDSLPAYGAAIFAVTIFAAYVAQSSEWLGYAGIQIGITFLICYVNLAPTSDIYKPLWRFWGVMLGVLITGFVFLLLWPEYASDKVVECLAKLTTITLSLGKAITEQRITLGDLARIEQRISTELLDTLNMADQARLEGRHGSEISTIAVEAAGLLIRIAYRFETIARARLAGSDLMLLPVFRERNAAQEHEYCSSLESWLEKLTLAGTPQRRRTTTSKPPLVETSSITSRARAVPQERVEWPRPANDNQALQFEAYRRLPVLLDRLDSVLSKIAI